MAYVNELNPASPSNASPRKYGAKEMRSLSSSLKETFPTLNAPVTVEASVFNQIGKFLRGMIIPFSGTDIPKGWVVCNEENKLKYGTPNLVGWFVKGSKEHVDPVETPAKELDVANFTKVAGHSLTINEIPAHYHIAGYQGGMYYAPQPGLGCDGLSKYFDGEYTSYTGEDAAHRHDVLQGKDEDGNPLFLTVEPSYYVLRYIMYVGDDK